MDVVHNCLENEAVVEIVLGLVNQQRITSLQQQDRKDCGAFLAGREHRRILFRVPHPQADCRCVLKTDRFKFREFLRRVEHGGDLGCLLSIHVTTLDEQREVSGANQVSQLRRRQRAGDFLRQHVLFHAAALHRGLNELLIRLGVAVLLNADRYVR